MLLETTFDSRVADIKLRDIILPLFGLFFGFALYVYVVGVNLKFIVFLTILPLLFLFLFNFKILLHVLPIFFFIHFGIWVFAISEIFAGMILLSFFLTHTDIDFQDFKFPLTKAFLFYLAVLIISVIKSGSPIMAGIGINHYVLFLAVIFVLYSSIKQIDIITNITNTYLFVLSLNTVHVIIEAITMEKRVFGFAGIMYVDYVGIGIVFFIIQTFFAKTLFKRMFYGFLTLFNVVGLVLTQTRTSWISTVITFFVVLFFLWLKHDYFDFDKKKLYRFTIVLVIVFATSVFIAILSNPTTFNRISDFDKMKVTETGAAGNSFVSRLFIWHTAYNGFMANPILGIGAYSFPYTSQNFYTINKTLYKTYVETLSPHQTFIAVAVETGIVGIIAFVSLYVSIVTYITKTTLQYTVAAHKQLVFLLSAGVLYCLISMFTTDAWLWGHGIILLALLLGMLFAHERIVNNKVT